MTQHKLATRLDLQALRHAAERGDARTLANLYAEDAEVRIVTATARPARPSCCAVGRRSPST